MANSLLNNNARNHPHYTTIQQFLERLDHLREYFLPVKSLDPKKLFTENRLDIEYRINFLTNVLEDELPFENTLVTFEVTGAELLNLIKYNIEVSRKSGGEELQISGLSYKYRINGDKSELLSALINGKEIVPEVTYKGGSIDFVLFSQSETYFGFTIENGVDSKILLSDAAIDFLSENKVIDAKITGAIIRVED